ncbi:unnamed protein product [Taenia asiatica]|uniref:28S ribosomal protein S34, mitochondrial n=1 Tax=Taenia asiatica TaxID=60517 RepID=A0A0R3VTH0_TAEAS|nr:unnamed protein product [Taenia asiatica]
MTKVKYVGRPSLDFFGKYLSEIANNLCDRGIGRIVIKESEKRMYKEPCFYVIKEIYPLMSDSSGVRCRAFAERVFRGHNFGVVPVPKSHEPDWRLLGIEEGRKLQKSVTLEPNRAPHVPVKCVAPMPPVLAMKLLHLGKIPQDIVAAARQAVPPNATAAAREGSGYLLLTKISDDPTLFQANFSNLCFQVPVEPTEEEKRRIFPSYHSQVASPKGLVRKTTDGDVAKARNVYYIRRGDTPGLRWRVELEAANVEDELLRWSPSSTPPKPSSSSPSSANSDSEAEHSKSCK